MRSRPQAPQPAARPAPSQGEAEARAPKCGLGGYLTPEELALYDEKNFRDAAILLTDRLEKVQPGAWFTIFGHAFWLVLNDPRWAASAPARRS